MENFLDQITQAKTENKTLFYNSSGSKQAYQLGIKHISSAEFLGFALKLPNAKLRIRKAFLLVDFEKKEIKQIHQGDTISPLPLTSY